MTPELLVNGLLTSVVEENMALYRDLFTHTDPGTANDPYWIRALALFGSLSAEQRQVFFEVLRQVAVDTTSNVLGIVDGDSYVEGGGGGCELRYRGQKLDRDLQSLFLAEVERRET